MTQAIHAFGTLLKLHDGGSPGAYTTIAEVKSIRGPSMQVETVDVTSHSSTSAFREFLSSLIDGGEVVFGLNFVPAGEATHDENTGLLYLFGNRIRRNFQLVFPDGLSTTWTFEGLVTGMSMDIPVDNALTSEVTVKVSGAPSWAL